MVVDVRYWDWEDAVVVSCCCRQSPYQHKFQNFVCKLLVFALMTTTATETTTRMAQNKIIRKTEEKQNINIKQLLSA